jgi:hypothetical protein
VHPEQLVLDVDRTVALQGLVEDVEVGPHGGGRALVGQPEHLVDDPVVRDAEAERQPAGAHGLGRQGLLGQGDGVPGLDGHHRRAHLDAAGLGADQGGGGEGVELVGDLRDPHRREAGLLDPAAVRAEPVDLRGVPAPLGTDHHPDAHRGPPPSSFRTRTSFSYKCNLRLGP